MTDHIMEGIKRHIQPLLGLEKAQLLEIEPGYAKISIEVLPEALNLYGNLHGGYIFTLCDTVAGMATYAYGISNVTLQGNINFLKGVNSGTIYVEATALHKGHKTVINQVSVTSDNNVLLATATFSMFLMTPVDGK